KIKLSSASNIAIQAAYPKSSNIQPKTTPTVYFKTAFWGNGMDHMNINIGHLSEPFFNPGDELAVFDGNICVGALTLMPHHFSNQAVSIVVSSADEFGMPGFREGNPFSLKLWSSAQNKEFVL